MEFTGEERQQFWAQAFIAIATAYLEKGGPHQGPEGKDIVIVEAAAVADSMMRQWAKRWEKEDER